MIKMVERNSLKFLIKSSQDDIFSHTRRKTALESFAILMSHSGGGRGVYGDFHCELPSRYLPWKNTNLAI